MPISSISTSFIHNHAPVMENAVSTKTPENSTLRAYQLIMRINPILQAFFPDYSDRPEIFWLYRSANTVRYILRVTQYAIFGKPYLHIPVNTIYSTTINIIYSTIYIIPKYATQNTTFNTIISILQYCYHIVTILISTLYSYIYIDTIYRSGIAVVQLFYTIIYRISVSSICIKSVALFCADRQQISS